jgi:branched-chain amino acid transport system permease protein
MSVIAILGIPAPALFGQLLLGLINGSFYAMLSLGLALIFGMLNIVNFSHGAFYMLGAFASWLLLSHFGLGYWSALIAAPLLVAALGMIVERTLLSRLRGGDHLSGMLLTFGLALTIEGIFRQIYGVSGLPYAVPKELAGGWNLGFMYLPYYRAWVVGVSLALCHGTWGIIEGTSLGSRIRAATENPALVDALGVNVPLVLTLTFGFGAALAGVAGVLAAPLYSVNPLMGSNLIIVVFAIVVIGGMGSIPGAIAAGYALGLLEGLTKVIYPEASNTIIFVVMALVLLVRPAGLFGKEA